MKPEFKSNAVDAFSGSCYDILGCLVEPDVLGHGLLYNAPEYY